MFRFIRIMCGNVLIRKKYIVVLAVPLALTIGAVFLPLGRFSLNVINRMLTEVTPLFEENIDLREHNINIVHTVRSDVTKEACAVESAAKANPSWRINVLLVKLRDKFVYEELMKTYPNIRLHRFYVDQLFGLYTPRFLRRSKDALKFMALRFFGGVVLDSDVIVMKSFESLKPNWLVRVGGNLTTAAMAVKLANEYWSANLISVHAHQLRKNIKHGNLKYSGGEALKITLEYCSLHQNKSLNKCPDFEFYNKTQFLVEFEDVQSFLKKSDTDFGYLIYPNVYLVRMRGKKENNGELKKAFPLLAKRYCPNVFTSHFKNTTQENTKKT